MAFVFSESVLYTQLGPTVLPWNALTLLLSGGTVDSTLKAKKKAKPYTGFIGAL